MDLKQSLVGADLRKSGGVKVRCAYLDEAVACIGVPYHSGRVTLCSDGTLSRNK